MRAIADIEVEIAALDRIIAAALPPARHPPFSRIGWWDCDRDGHLLENGVAGCRICGDGFLSMSAST